MSKDLTGEKFGRFVVLRLAVQGSRRVKTKWECLCECGAVRIVVGHSLISGHSKSCGCLHREIVSAVARKRMTKHGQTARLGSGRRKSPTWNSWYSMIVRCTDPSRTDYNLWGGRGIKVCERWMDFTNFIADMGVRQSGTTLDRINNDGHYEPSNCRWATKKEQGRNRRGNVLVEYNNRSLTVAEWSEISGIKAATLYARVRAGRAGEDLFSPPLPWCRIRSAHPDLKVFA